MVATSGGRRTAELVGDAPWLPRLEVSAPKFVEGLARVADAISTDGTLPAGLKQVFAAAICAVKRDEALVDHFVAAAAKSGVPREHVEGASVGLLISRGITPHASFVAATDKAYGPVDPAAADPEATAAFDADVPGAYAYFRRYFGFVPDYVELLGDRVAGGLEGYFLMRESSLAETPLPARDMELLLCAVNAAEYQPRFVAIHSRGARRAGASEEQLVEATLVALPFSGVASWLPAAQGILDSRDVAGA
ncbi:MULTISPECIES: carboxymuconolactone decarboxylase family protein [unclassified Pseudonocardia]|jgi:alkylhydroperoxidase/carboxymuconolactone decarboxylase family protein YurZ|uniref:carboxymuconolactone decarboxylase family protein n=1 Tax=unclassified Pseudonocardia TaxID=2619320 RepID=UPI000AF2BA81|nr:MULTISPECIES: carboxymuconolactone decarboxylase family protein [unclassified Pseudonocardia]MBN9098658.1 carboxymuconolactone decarboxylase family protein [Pseudonocardia sp.]